MYLQLEESMIKDQIKLVLSKGVSYGFLQRSGNRYSVDPVVTNTEEPMDRHGHRRAKKSHKRGGKRGKSRRHKSKSRSRSRRRR